MRQYADSIFDYVANSFKNELRIDMKYFLRAHRQLVRASASAQARFRLIPKHSADRPTCFSAFLSAKLHIYESRFDFLLEKPAI